MLAQVEPLLFADAWLIAPQRFHDLAKAVKITARTPQGPAAFTMTDERRAGQGMEIAEGIAIIPVHGVMIRGVDWYDEICNTARLESNLLEVSARGDVHTVILHLDSPGGEASGCAELAALVREVATKKRVVAWVEKLCASAAYYVAAAADEIYSRPTATVGSIGCYHALLDDSKLWEEIGFKLEAFTSAPGKLYGHPGKPFEEDARAFFQSRVNELGGQFRAFVESRRPAATEAATASGVYGSAATWGTENGLVDGTALTFPHLLAELLPLAD